MKNAKKYICLYKEKAEDCFINWGYYYPPRSWDEFFLWNTKIFNDYLKGKENNVNTTKTYVGLLDTTNYFGFYLAFQKLDCEILNNVLFQTSRQELLNNGMLASGADHCGLFLYAACAFACNDFEIIDHFFPSYLPHSKGAFYTEISVNLLRLGYYKENELKAEALTKAYQFLEKKITLWEQYVVEYLLSLVNRQAEKSSRCLQKLCVAYQKIGYPKSKLDKCFASEIHGLYRFARIIDEDFFYKIIHPKHPSFSEEFEVWQKENNYPKGNLFYKYPNEMNYMNKIFEAQLPSVVLIKVCSSGRNKFYMDVDKFALDLTENVNKIL